MNCFQKFVSLIFWTTINTYINRFSSCELLSKVCIFDILNNCMLPIISQTQVVNCFQKFVSLIFWTTEKIWQRAWSPLWIAFKSLYLWYSEQRIGKMDIIKVGCELLSKVCIFDILNNAIIDGVTLKELWIAFKSLYLWYSEQHLEVNSHEHPVVNCFQKFVSLIFWTTPVSGTTSMRRLWIAFKSLYLWYSEQQWMPRLIPELRCELLSKVCIFDILNNINRFSSI